MVTGRPRKPDIIKASEGNPGKRRLNRNEISESPVIPPTPKWLSKPARKKWREVCEFLYTRRIIRREDGTMIAILCDASAQLEAIVSELDAMTKAQPAGSKFLVKSGGSAVVNPLFYLKRDTIQTIHRVCQEFGMTAAARSRLRLDDDVIPAEADDLERMLSGIEHLEDDLPPAEVIQ